MTKVAVEYLGPGPIAVQVSPGLVARWAGPGIIQLPEPAARALIGSHAIGGGKFRFAAQPAEGAKKGGKK